jgi:hypothetical protein
LSRCGKETAYKATYYVGVVSGKILGKRLSKTGWSDDHEAAQAGFWVTGAYRLARI